MKKVEEVIKRIWMDGFYGEADEVIKFMDEIKDSLTEAQLSHERVCVDVHRNEFLVIYGYRDQNEQ